MQARYAFHLLILLPITRFQLWVIPSNFLSSGKVALPAFLLASRAPGSEYCVGTPSIR